ncbi:uncharacterized protein HD556DRAFT_1449771 [Suillus plorans]|uniref:BAH domain-containing protein n=1 Tax=Suillus plorans TaxID=116603 RepID=A0A9P7ADW3_9AGAM|nr:uncharacterized protein HD556DRAFT_1449771 [Suillus plorans]KAG1786394.1 hypothetical protein HD556DRAFT_1449771 [Suillus plorans]
MSVRPSIISSVSHTGGRGRRTLPPMNSHPRLHKLRRCTSLEWMYDSNEDSDMSVDYCRLVIRVGDDVAIFPLDKRSVPTNDGSLPIMSYWYGKVEEIYLKTVKQKQDVWLNIRWYYRQVDLEDQGVNLAAFVGEYELILSDHTSIVDMHCIEDHATIIQYDEEDLAQPQIPGETLYYRWTVSMQFETHRNVIQLQGVHIENSQVSTRCSCDSCDHSFSSPYNLQRYCRTCQQWFNDTCLVAVAKKMERTLKMRLPSIYDAVEFDKEFLALLTTPIRRGGHFGVVGNGIILFQVKSLLEDALTLGRLPDGWMDRVQLMKLSSVDDAVPRYYCPVCKRVVV